MKKINIVAEIGINHNGSMEIAKLLIMQAKNFGFDFVKIQKRNPDLCIPETQKKIMKETPWGKMSYLEYKKKIELSEDNIKTLAEFSKTIGIEFFASVWDLDSVNLMKKYCTIGKIPSAMITNLDLCRSARKAFPTLIISTGMSNERQISTCVHACNPDIIMHSVSIYPSPPKFLNLNYISWLRKKYSKKQIGYSGHELGVTMSVAAAALGACWIERHVTLDNNIWGSDQELSLNPVGMEELVKQIRMLEQACSDPAGPRVLLDEEAFKLTTLRQ